MIQKYSSNNVEAMISSIHSNSELITNMVKRTNENDKKVNEKMKIYATNKQVFSQEQINLYKDYIDNKNEIEHILNNYADEIKNIGGIKAISSEICRDDSDCSSIHKAFDKINSLQIKIMEMLCGLMGKANMLIAAI